MRRLLLLATLGLSLLTTGLAGATIYSATLISQAPTQMNVNQFGSSDQLVMTSGNGNVSGAVVGGLPLAGANVTT